MVCVNEVFWQYAKEGVETGKKHLFPGHDVEFLLWSDMPEYPGVTLFPVDPAPWPYPTLMRYHLFLQQEEYLQKFDKLLYLDTDMRVVQDIKVEILGDGLTCAKHPMYALDRRFIPPYEPNPNSSAFIPRFGQILTDNRGKYWFDPVYAAGGIQGGATKPFIEAMWWMRRSIDRDLQNNYIAIWNDESHWNAYLSSHPDDRLIVLGPEYVHPDSLISEYYHKIWGRIYEPKIYTLTKKHTLTKQGGDDLARMLGQASEPVVPVVCAQCHDVLLHPQGLRIAKVTQCHGAGNSHDCELLVLSSANTLCPTCQDFVPVPENATISSCGGRGGLHSYVNSV